MDLITLVIQGGTSAQSLQLQNSENSETPTPLLRKHRILLIVKSSQGRIASLAWLWVPILVKPLRDLTSLLWQLPWQMQEQDKQWKEVLDVPLIASWIKQGRHINCCCSPQASEGSYFAWISVPRSGLWAFPAQQSPREKAQRESSKMT